MNLAHGLAEAIAVPRNVLLAQPDVDARLEAETPTALTNRPLPGDGEACDGIAEREGDAGIRPHRDGRR